MSRSLVESALLQCLMDAHTTILNLTLNAEKTKSTNIALHEAQKVQEFLMDAIREYRESDHPFCYGLDDCSTNMLSVCTW